MALVDSSMRHSFELRPCFQSLGSNMLLMEQKSDTSFGNTKKVQNTELLSLKGQAGLKGWSRVAHFQIKKAGKKEREYQKDKFKNVIFSGMVENTGSRI